MANPNLQMFRSDTPTVEIGTVGNPIDLGFCLAGVDTILPYDIILWNDKGDVLDSDDAYNIYVELLRLDVSQSWVSTGLDNQTFTLTYIPLVSDLQAVVVDDSEWTRVTNLVGQEQNTVYTLDYITGVLTFGDNINGKIPPVGTTIAIDYTPDLNTYSKLVYSDQWLSVQSSGVVENVLSVSIELSTKLDNSTVEVIHFPYLESVVGVWDNIGKTGTNYYTGGSFDSHTGRILLGTSLTTPDPYVEYYYRIKDDNEGGYTLLGNGERHGPLYRIPRNNAKRLQVKVSVPSTASTEGGAYIKALLRVLYQT